MPKESTTPDLVELTQRLLDAANARDVEAGMSLYAPDAVLDMGETFEVFEGRAAMRGFAEDWLGLYEEFEFELEEIRDLGDGVTFGVWVQRGRPRGSTAWVQVRVAFVSTWADGLIERTTNYTDIDQARAAAERLGQERG